MQINRNKNSKNLKRQFFPPLASNNSFIAPRKNLTIAVTLLLILLWNLSVWHFSEQSYLENSNQLIQQQTRLSQEHANDLANSMQRNLGYLTGIPNLLSKLLPVKWALTKFNGDTTPSAATYEERRWRWTEDPGLNDLSRYLAVAKKSLHADLIYVVNAAGDCVAASNWDTTGTSIGTNFIERDYFKQNREGQQGMQYAVGKTTHIAGLYFSSPVIVDGKFLGAVVAKADVPNLSYLIKQFDAFVTDHKGAIILATEKELEMHFMPDASISSMSEQDIFARYQKHNLPPLKISDWNDPRFPTLMRFENETEPHVLAHKELPEYGLTVYVESEVASIPVLNSSHRRFTWLLCALGSVLILAIGGSVLYLQSLKLSKELLWEKANFDTLTGLPNRDMFRDRLTQEFKKSDRSALPVALLLIDLDLFKEVNDTLGHEAGDVLLQQAAQRISNCVRETDTVARLGGDEFTVILSQLSDTRHAEVIAQKIIDKLSEPFQLKGETAHISASLGITLYPLDGYEIESLMRNADQAMYAAKKNGRNGYSYYTVSLQEAAQKRLRITNDLRVALTDQQLKVYFQPIIELSTGHVHKAEALLRWIHPVHGMISPAEFIPLAEETRLIVNIGSWVRGESINWCKRWNELDPKGFQISINKSPVEFMDENDSDKVNDFIREIQGLSLSGQNFVFEITEGLLLNSDPRINIKLMELRDAGIQVSIDDFGTGYSSLSYLKKFDIDYLKIDQSFVHNLEHDSDNVALCEAIIVMAHKLGLKVIAEGVETEQQRQLLLGAGCDYAQGYLFSRPVPPDAFESWLVENNRRLT